MDNAQIIFSGTTSADFLESLISNLRSIIKEEMKAATKDQDDRLLSPAETCKLFTPPITKPTLSAWTAKGLLQEHRIGGRVFYKQSEIMDSLVTLKKYKNQSAPCN